MRRLTEIMKIQNQYNGLELLSVYVFNMPVQTFPR